MTNKGITVRFKVISEENIVVDELGSQRIQENVLHVETDKTKKFRIHFLQGAIKCLSGDLLSRVRKQENADSLIAELDLITRFLSERVMTMHTRRSSAERFFKKSSLY